MSNDNHSFGQDKLIELLQMLQLEIERLQKDVTELKEKGRAQTMQLEILMALTPTSKEIGVNQDVHVRPNQDYLRAAGRVPRTP